MSRIFITGSSDGLGLITARNLIAKGHKVTLHARNAARARDALAGAPGAQGCLVGDLASLQEVKALAKQANDAGRFDTVLHNAALGVRAPPARMTDAGVADVFAVNVLAPYVLTALMHRPQRIVYVSSGLHSGGDDSLTDVGWTARKWTGFQAYCDSKLMDVMLAFAVARLWPAVHSSAVNPGWVVTKLGGAGAPNSADSGAVTMTYLAETNDAIPTGRYWDSMAQKTCHGAANDVQKQDELLRICEEISRVSLLRM